MLDFTRSGLPNVSQSKSNLPLYCGQIIAFFSLTQICILLEYVATNSIMIISHAMHCTLNSAQRSFEILVSNVGSPETFLHQNLVVLNRHYMDSLNLNCLKQDPTTIGTCGRIIITSLYCISTFAINIYILATSSTRHSCITLTCISSDATNVRSTLHHNSLANA